MLRWQEPSRRTHHNEENLESWRGSLERRYVVGEVVTWRRLLLNVPPISRFIYTVFPIDKESHHRNPLSKGDSTCLFYWSSSAGVLFCSPLLVDFAPPAPRPVFCFCSKSASVQNWHVSRTTACLKLTYPKMVYIENCVCLKSMLERQVVVVFR